MSFRTEEAFLQPSLVGTHIYKNGEWHEWDGVLSAGDIQIGAVEIKDGDEDHRAHVSAGGLLSVFSTRDYVSARATGSGALSLVASPGVPWRLEQVRVHLSAVGASGDLVMDVDDGDGAEYNARLLTQPMATISDFVWRPQNGVILGATDDVSVTWANAGGVTYGIKITYSKL